MELTLCHHCGEAVQVSTRESENGHIYHTDCTRNEKPKCKRAVDYFLKKNSLTENILSMAIHVNYLYGIDKEVLKAKKLSTEEAKREKKEKRGKRELKLREILKNVTALRNSNSGYLIIQLVGLAADDSFTGAFDELVDQKLNELIEDGTLFGSAFKKNDFLFEGERFIVLYVEGTDAVTAFDYQTKVALDSSIVTPSPSAIRRLVQKGRRPPSNDFPPAITDFKTINENRTVQLKSIIHIQDGLQERVWEELKLREYISAFAKNDEGGVYVLGIEEVETKYQKVDYVSKKCDIHGMKLSVCEDLKKHIENAATESLITYDFDGRVLEDVELIKVSLTDMSTLEGVQSKYKGNYLLQVAVRPVNGIVFYDRDGPLAYRIVDRNGTSEIEKVPYKDWLKLLKGKYTTIPN